MQITFSLVNDIPPCMSLHCKLVPIENINMAYLKNTQSSKKKNIFFPPIEERFNNKGIVMSASNDPNYHSLIHVALSGKALFYSISSNKTILLNNSTPCIEVLRNFFCILYPRRAKVYGHNYLLKMLKSREMKQSSVFSPGFL